MHDEFTYPALAHITSDGIHSLCGAPMPGPNDPLPSDWFDVLAKTPICATCEALDC
jgi:hypothetical protein